MHTPGPWETSVLADGSQWEVCCPNAGDAIAGIVDGPEAKDNAFLIAAAPDMLAALQKLIGAIDRLPGNNPLDGLADEARAAIARATGKD